MPSARPRASFEPIPPDFDVRTFVETADNFQYVDRISYEMIANNGIEQFEKLVLLHVIIGGKPLVIDGFEEVLDPWTFTPAWLRDNYGDKVENARNLTAKENIPLTIRHYLKHLGKLTEQFFDGPERYRDKTRQRIYLKDIDCPPVWQDKLKEHIPSGLFYLNESTGEIGGPGALEEDGLRRGRGIGRAGDLMSSLPPEMRAENLMCYIGHEGTYTPSHREMCASLGQNIMVNASSNIGEDGQPEHLGSSIWFMTETKDRHIVSEYWLSVLGHDIEVENHFAQLIAWKRAPFNVYVVEQRPGDFILIPPLAPHQVWNRGTRTMKIAWNRTTVETLELAINEALPNSRVVCRDEQYKNKAIVYYTLLKYSALIKAARAQVELGGEQAEAVQRSVKVRHVQRDFKRLFDLYKTILLTEMFAPDSRERPEFLPYDSNITCAYCRCNIFNRFLTCKACPVALQTLTEEPYDICMDCYCMGRSCACQSRQTWAEQWKWKDLIHKYEEWRAQIVDIDGHMTEKTPLPLQEERRYLGKKTLAQVCQEQLRMRPFVDIKQPQAPEDESEDEEIQVNDDGTVKKMVKKKSKEWLNAHKSCHFCLKRHPKWKMAMCTNCDLAYCYGTLFRAHDMMPLTIMEDPNWKCPHCRRVCNTGNCRRDPRQHPYEPKGTLLGHDTKKVADQRSVECLVDFGVSNLNWIREDEGASNSVRLQRRRDEAEQDKLNDPVLDERFVDEHHISRDGIEYSPVEDSNVDIDNSLIDPSLRGVTSYVDNDRSLHQGFVNLSSVEYGHQPDNGHDAFGEPHYPSPDISGEIPRFGTKRAREDDNNDEEIRRDGKQAKKQKKKKDAPQQLQPKNASGKQYQKEMERKLLEDARKEGRFILVAARMKGKSRIVKLSLPTRLLERFRTRTSFPQAPVQAQEAIGRSTDTRSILQSDILPPTTGGVQSRTKPKAPKAFRVRVEDDDDFGTRKRDRAPNGAGPNGKPKRSSRYEEFRLDSDEEADSDDMVEYTNFNRTGGSKGRASTWLARKNQGENDDMPTELPPNFKDGDVNPRARDRDRERRERRKTMPGNSKFRAQIRPSRPAQNRKSTGNISDEDALGEVDDPLDSALKLAQKVAVALETSRKAEAEKTRAREAEENLKAKMMIADEWSGDDKDNDVDEHNNDDNDDDHSINDLIDTIAADAEQSLNQNFSNPPLPALPRSGPPVSQTSIFSRPGMANKKIKIVSARRQQPPSTLNGENGSNSTTTKTTTNITTPASAPASTFTPVNKNKSISSVSVKPVSKKIDLSSESSSDSSSEDEIPARAPTYVSKPRTTGVVPSFATRGSIRGRGRPRGRPRGRGRGY